MDAAVDAGVLCAVEEVGGERAEGGEERGPGRGAEDVEVEE